MRPFTLVFFAGLAISLVLTPLVRNLAIHLDKFLDKPKERRRVHSTATPRVGGAAIFIAFIAALALALLFSSHLRTGGIDLTTFGRMLICSTAMMVLGLVDDAFQLQARTKFYGQLLV